MLIGLNATDAKNAVTAFTRSFVKENDLWMEAEPLQYENTEELIQAFDQHRIEVACMATTEYWLIRPNTTFDRFMNNHRQGDTTVVYVLLAKKNSPIATLADLQGKRLISLANPSMNLSDVWLDVELTKASFPTLAKMAGSITTSTKPTRVVLPVFFGQADACITTRHSYDLMVELNPQVGEQLRIIAASPPLVPEIYGFAPAHSEPTTRAKDKAIRSLLSLHQSITGKQTLTMLQIDKITECAISILSPSLALLDEHARLCPEANTALIANLRGLKTDTPSTAPPPTGPRYNETLD